jgi:hypothetical protein
MDSAVPGLWEKLEVLSESEDERIALNAIRDMMDRAGYKAVDYSEQKVEVTVSGDAAKTVADRLAKLKKGQEEKAELLKQMKAAHAGTEDVVDAEVVEDDE